MQATTQRGYVEVPPRDFTSPDQLVLIAYWLYEKSHRVRGHYDPHERRELQLIDPRYPATS